jgi:hypothetical protein
MDLVAVYMGAAPENKVRLAAAVRIACVIDQSVHSPFFSRTFKHEPEINTGITANSVGRKQFPAIKPAWGPAGEIKMNPVKAFSAALAATIMIAGLSPAFAQTRTDPVPDRPRTERGDGDGEVQKPIQAKLPRGADGTTCIAESLDLSVGFGVLLENETGKVIPKGTVITLYVQPGNIQQMLQLNFDWKPGVHLSYTFFGDYSYLSLPMECSFKLSPGRGPAEPRFEIPADEPKRQVIPRWKFQPQSTPVPPEQEDFVPDPADFACWVDIDENGVRTVYIKNVSDVGYPPGTSIAVTFDNGKTLTMTWVGYFGDGKTEDQPLANEAYWGTPETCTVEVRIAGD